MPAAPRSAADSRHVFISHSSEDVAVAEKVRRALEFDGLATWICSRDIKPGQTWARAISDGVERSGALVLLFTANANHSEHVLREVDSAVKQRIPILPVRLDDTPPSKDIKYYINVAHWIDATDGRIDPHLDSITDGCRSLLGEPESGSRKPKASATKSSRNKTTGTRAAKRAPARKGTRSRRPARGGMAVILRNTFAEAAAAQSPESGKTSQTTTARQPENHSKKYAVLFADIDAGRTKLPMFQRDFVWDKSQTAKLIDSILKGFPVGTFILWKTRDRFRHFREIGNLRLPEPPAGDAVQYVLDGQQRITSLYAVRKGLRITRDDRVIDYKDICIDLDAGSGAEEEVVYADAPKGRKTISVHDLLTKDITDFDAYAKDERRKIHDYRAALTGHDFSVIEIPEYDIDTACEIFTRINTGGKELSLFEIMVAKTFDPDSGFDLERKYFDLLEGDDEGNKSLTDASFETIPAITILQCVAAHLKDGIRHGDILRLDRQAVIDCWPHVQQTIFAAIDHMQSHLGVAVSRILPYPVLIVAFSHFFDRNKLKPADHDQTRYLTEYFYRAGLSNRYSSGTAVKMLADLQKMKSIAEGKRPSYKGEDLEISPDTFRTKTFAINDAFSKTVLCLLASKAPRNLQTNGLIKLNNSWLRKSSSRNIHHIFPKAWVRKHGKRDWDANVIANIMLADEYSNQRLIKSSAPKEWVARIAPKGSSLLDSFRAHLVSRDGLSALQNNAYPTFIASRSRQLFESVEESLQGSIG